MKKYCFFILGLFMTLGVSAQSISSYVITSAGSSLMSSEGALYISMGEPMSTEISEGEIMISQGFLNVSIEGLPVSTDDLLTETINAFPNPTSAEILIDLVEMDGRYTYQLSNAMGLLVESETLTDRKTNVNMKDMDSGVYYMRIIKEDKQSKTLKIIKL